MKLDPLFLLMATLTVLSPGPGVVMTLTNALRHGRNETLGGILGVATGALVVAAISATGLGLLLATSALAFTALKFVGAAYLVYLGIRLWRAPAFRFEEKATPDVDFGKRFLEGITLQLTNPKAIFFFLSVFPQFIDPARAYVPQFAILVLSYGTLVVIFHCIYAAFARRLKAWLTSSGGGRVVNRVGGTMFIVFGAMLATAKAGARP